MRSVRLSLANDIVSAKTARDTLRAWLIDHGCRRTDDAVLVLSELVTNAVVHARCAPHVVMDYANGVVQLEVHDTARSLPAMRGGEGLSVGYGLRLVETLCDAWGAERTWDGKKVWCELRC